MQAWGLDAKIVRTQHLIKEWCEYWNGKVYLSFSGGKDSTVLADLMARFCKAFGYKLILVFINTRLEFPEIVTFVDEFVIFLKAKYEIHIELIKKSPDMSFPIVVKTYGYPVASKEISKIIYGARHSKNKKQSYLNKLDGLNPDFTFSEFKQRYKKWKYLLDAPFEISNRCCYYLKEKPCMDYEKETGNKPILATMAEDSRQRKDGWIKTGCNAFESEREISKPMSFWTEQDVLLYIKRFNIPYCSVYGDIVLVDVKKRNKIITQKLVTTGETRTGCMFCMYGCHLDKFNRFQRMGITHPKRYDYCIFGGEFNSVGNWEPNNQGLGLNFVLDFVNVKFEKAVVG